MVLADSRYTIQARREAPEARLFEAYGNLPDRWPDLVRSVGARRVGVEAGFVSHATWQRLAAAAPDVELVPVEGWVEADRAIKEPAELERVAAACAVADRALATLLSEIRPGATEAELALRLEWLMRTGGAEALAFDVACLSGPEAALPHGAPGDRPILADAVLLFDFGAQVAGYRSDMTRTLFVGEPSPRDLGGLRARGRGAGRRHRGRRGRGDRQRGAAERPGRGRRRAIDHRGGRPRRAFRSRHRPRDRPRHPRSSVARQDAQPRRRCRARPSSRSSPASTSTGRWACASRTSSTLDAATGRVERVTRFPREVLVVG